MENVTKGIKVGSIVQYNDGYYRITKKTKTTVNLGSIFGRGVYHKGIALHEVVEAEAAWQRRWEQSETYQSM